MQLLNQNIGIVDLDNVFNYLMQKKLINKKSIIDSDLIIKDKSSMNKNIQIIRKNNESYLIKQPHATNGYNNTFINKEAKLYHLIHANSKFSPIRAAVPRFIRYDRHNNLLIIEFIKNTKTLSLTDVAEKNYTENFNLLGKIIAAYHNLFQQNLNSSLLSFLPKSLPLTLYIARPRPEILSNMSPGNFELLKIIQHEKQIQNFLAKIPNQWKIQTIIHGDAKFDNVLVSANKNSKKKIMKIIDWELASAGDPAWDIATMLSDLILQNFYLSLSDTMISENDTIKQFALVIKKIKTPMKIFWRSYYTNLDKQKLFNNEFVPRCVKYCIAKMVQATYDSLHWSDQVTDVARNVIELCSYLIENRDQRIQKILEA